MDLLFWCKTQWQKSKGGFSYHSREELRNYSLRVMVKVFSLPKTEANSNRPIKREIVNDFLRWDRKTREKMERQ
jgi:hypothetical protein